MAKLPLGRKRQASATSWPIVVCATDLSDAGATALRQASEAAKERSAKLVVLHVLPATLNAHPIQPLARHTSPAQIPQAIAAAIDRVNAHLQGEPVTRDHVDVRVEYGIPHAVIVERAEMLRAELIVVGASREHVGHEAERVVRYAHCPGSRSAAQSGHWSRPGGYGFVGFFSSGRACGRGLCAEPSQSARAAACR